MMHMESCRLRQRTARALVVLASAACLVGIGVLFRLQSPRPMTSESLERTELIPEQDDPWMIQFVREHYILGPHNASADYSLSVGDINADQSEGQVDAVRKLFKNVTTGFFIECGANDGEFPSNTLWFEKVLGWNGLLIEADPYTFQLLRQKNRKTWHANVCLSPTAYPTKLTFFRAVNGNGAQNGLRSHDAVNQPIVVDCIPLYTLLAAITQTVIDLFSLDIEGAEFEVLKTIPFDEITFKVLIIDHSGFSRWELKKFMNSKGFKLFYVMDTNVSKDSIYVADEMLPANFTELHI